MGCCVGSMGSKMLFFKQTNYKDRSGESGLSLVELAIALMIIGLITIPMIKAYDIDKMDKIKGATRLNLAKINSAMDYYYKVNGRFPCPADPMLTPNDPNYGLEVSPCGNPNNWVGNANALLQPTSTDPLVAQGAVPFITLNIPPEAALDGYKNRFMYAVTRIQTETTSFNANGGQITANARTWDTVADDWNTNNTFNPANNASTDPNQPHGAYYIVVSLGDNAGGAYNAEGALVAACPAAPLIDNENCDGDSVFWQSNERRSLGFNDDYYDDNTLAINGFSQDIWSYDASNNILSEKTRLGIGTRNPAYNLDVEGIMQTSDVLEVETMCDPDNHIANYADGSEDNKCFDINRVAGSGMNCPAGMVATGISGSNGGEMVGCGAVPYAVTGNCGTYAVGIGPGNVLICAP